MEKFVEVKQVDIKILKAALKKYGFKRELQRNVGGWGFNVLQGVWNVS